MNYKNVAEKKQVEVEIVTKEMEKTVITKKEIPLTDEEQNINLRCLKWERLQYDRKFCGWYEDMEEHLCNMFEKHIMEQNSEIIWEDFVLFMYCNSLLITG